MPAFPEARSQTSPVHKLLNITLVLCCFDSGVLAQRFETHLIEMQTISLPCSSEHYTNLARSVENEPL